MTSPHFAPRRMRSSLQPLVAGLALALLVGCSTTTVPQTTPERLQAVLPTDMLLLGEQHDAPEHQVIHQHVVQKLADGHRLAALALEMADTGTSTSALPRDASEDAVQQALQWNDKGWPWKHYGPAVMAAVRAGVPVVGANLPRLQMRATMTNSTLDARLPGTALQAQQEAIRTGHCNLLPASQIAPMARIQIAKDISMANTLVQNLEPGKVVVLLAGSGHVDRVLGVPQHLPADKRTTAVRLLAQPATAAIPSTAAFDVVWTTPPVPEKDYCAGLKSPSVQPKAQP